MERLWEILQDKFPLKRESEREKRERKGVEDGEGENENVSAVPGIRVNKPSGNLASSSFQVTMALPLADRNCVRDPGRNCVTEGSQPTELSELRIQKISRTENNTRK